MADLQSMTLQESITTYSHSEVSTVLATSEWTKEI